MNVIEEASHKKSIAHRILKELDLINLWNAVGTPVIVGALAYDLMSNPDIDMEIYCDTPDVVRAFSILGKCVTHPNVKSVRYSNHLDGPDKGIYYQIRYLEDDGTTWKIDMWLLANDHPGPCAKDLVKPLLKVLDEDKRRAILTLKEKLRLERDLNIGSINIYEAVIDHNITDIQEFIHWYHRQPKGLTYWKPKT